MSTIMFSTEDGVPVALLMLAESRGTNRECVLLQPPWGANDSLHAAILLRGRPIEYASGYANETDGTVVAFQNQDGWRILINLDHNDEGDWLATRGSETVFGQASRVRAA
jgi:hypothetical protein